MQGKPTKKIVRTQSTSTSKTKGTSDGKTTTSHTEETSESESEGWVTPDDEKKQDS